MVSLSIKNKHYRTTKEPDFIHSENFFLISYIGFTPSPGPDMGLEHMTLRAGLEPRSRVGC